MGASWLVTPQKDHLGVNIVRHYMMPQLLGKLSSSYAPCTCIPTGQC